MDSLPRTALVLEDCENHLTAIATTPNVDSSAVEAYLARHAILVLCAEVEQTITDIVYERVDRGGCDPEVANMLRARRKGMVRNAKHGEIADTLGQLSVDIQTKYTDGVAASIGEAGITRLGDTVAARDQLSHSANPPNVTLRDVREAYVVAEAVVSAARAAVS